jgi:hypothetical protein
MSCRSGEYARAATAAAPSRWFASLARGGFAALTGCVMVGGTLAATLAAAGHVLALSVDARSDTRTLVGRAQAHGGLQWFAAPDRGMVPFVLKSEPLTQAGTLAAHAPQFVLVATAGAFEGDDDLLFTGAIGHAEGRFVARQAPSPLLREDPLRPDGALPIASSRPLPNSLPLPRARPQFASLTPPDIGTRLEDSAPLAKTAIYDINARTVYLPNGERLEAHSGLGEHMDDPRHVRLRMRGVTPPNTYRLRMREALFHGVEAIRMLPENEAAMFGRDGILAHSYMLGPSGQSNGCVSFKNYPKFLAAFKRGEIERMVVVFRLAKPPTFLAKGGLTRSAKLF